MYCWQNFSGNLRVHVVIPIGPRLFPLAPFTLYVFILTTSGWGCSLSKHEIVAPVSNTDTVLLQLMFTRKFVAYFILVMVTLIISSVHDSHSESDEESKLLLGLSESWWSSVSSVSDFVPLSIWVWPATLLTWSCFVVLWTCLSKICKLLWCLLG